MRFVRWILIASVCLLIVACGKEEAPANPGGNAPPAKQPEGGTGGAGGTGGGPPPLPGGNTK